MGRYIAQTGNPPYVWDSLKEKVASTHIDYSGAVNRAYILNAYSTGMYSVVTGGRA